MLVLPVQCLPEAPECGPPVFVIGHRLPERGPEIPRVLAVRQVDDFMSDDVIHEAHRRLNDPPVEPKDTLWVAASPPFRLLSDQDARNRDAEFFGPDGHPFR
jgi:hypothetical protein